MRNTQESNQLSSNGKKMTVNIFGQTFTVRAMSDKESERYEKQREIDRKREKKRSIESLKINSLMDKKFKKCTFKNFTKTSENVKYFELAKYYVNNFELMKNNNNGLLLFGEAGTGKSYLSFCIANELLEKGVPVIAATSGAILQRIRELSSFGSDELNTFYRQLQRVDLLIIDDLGSEPNTEWVNSKIYEIIDIRYRSERPIIITTNLKPFQLKNKLATSDGVARTYDRIYEMCRQIMLSASPIRIKIGDKKQQEFNRMVQDL